MAEALTIPDRPDTHDVYDIRFLRETGLKLLQQYSGNIWTDYNTHDPGVTLLETFCLALAELGYRADYSVTEIIGTDMLGSSDTPFPAAYKVFPSSPVTFNDLRRLVFDVKGIRNSHIRRSTRYPECKGIFEIDLYLSEDADDEKNREEIRSAVENLVAVNRKPGEDCVAINFLEPVDVGFELDLEISRHVDPALFYHRIIALIEEYLSPFLNIHSYEDLKAAGYDNAAIFEGPMIRNGFVTNEGMEDRQFLKVIHTSDIIPLLMDEPDVKAVRKIKIRDSHNQKPRWEYIIPANSVPRISTANTKITLWYKGAVVHSLSLENTRIDRNLQSLPKPYDLREANRYTETTATERLMDYTPLQNDLPQTYGVGEFGLGNTATAKREAQARQLRGYLRIFDQLLFNSFHQLAHIKHLLSPESITASYASAFVRGGTDEALLFKPFTDTYQPQLAHENDPYGLARSWKKYLEEETGPADKRLRVITESEMLFSDRRNRALNHLLARFGYDLSYFEFVSGLSEAELITYKENLFRQLHRIDRYRCFMPAPAGNYISGKTELYRGFEHRLAALTGIRSKARTSLTAPVRDFFETGETTGNSFSLVIESYKSEDPFRILFESGCHREMYTIDFENGQTRVSLYNAAHRRIAYMDTENEQEAAIRIDKLAAKMAELDVATEGFHLVDHLLLRPGDAASCYGFDVLVDHEMLFECPAIYTRSERDRLLEAFAEAARNKDTYTVTEAGYKQYIVVFRSGELEVRSCIFYPDAYGAAEAVAEYVRKFSLENRTQIRPTTVFRDAYIDTEDPFSNMLTVVLPDWPSRFSNEAYRKYIEETFARETPAHLVVNIRWLTFDAMSRFEETWGNWLTARYETPGDTAAQTETLHRLFDVLTS